MALVLAMVIALMTPLLAAAQQDPAKAISLTEEQQKIFAVLDRFDPLDTGKLPFIQVVIGERAPPDEKDPGNIYRCGFLLNSEGKRFRVRFLDLTEREFELTPKNTPADDRVGFHPTDIRTVARAFVTLLKAMNEDRDRLWFYLSPNTPAHPTAMGIFLARACARRGLAKEVESLWEVLPAERGIVSSVANALAVRLRLDFGNTRFRFKDLHDRHKLWLSEFSGSLRTEFVEGVKERLERMLAEDAKRPTRRGARSPPDLVHDLRHEFTSPRVIWFSAWRVPPTGPEPKQPSSTIAELEKLDLKAVPALIDALHDETLTRSVVYSSRYGGSFYIETVGQIASALLEKRSGLDYWQLSDDMWRKWYDSVLKNGEEATLATYVGRTDQTSCGAARQLLKLWPHRTDAVLSAVKKHGIKPRLRSQLVGTLQEIDRPEVVKLLVEELSKGPDLTAKLAAAEMLGQIGRREGLEFVLRAWDKARHPRYVDLMLQSGDAEAVQKVLENIENPWIRTAAWDCVSLAELHMFVDKATKEQRSRIENMIEDILARMLRDGTRTGASHSFWIGDKSVDISNPSRAELAACTLMKIWPAVYSFDVDASASTRAREVLRIRNVWHSRRNLPPLEIPTKKDHRSRDPRLLALVAGIREHNLTPRKAVDGMQQYGLGALPWVSDLLRELPTKHKARPLLEELGSSLCNIVREIELDTKGRTVPKSLQDKLDSLKGKVLESRALIELLLLAIDFAPGKQCAVHLHAERTGEDNGVVLRLRIQPTLKDQGTTSRLNMDVRAAGVQITSRAGAGVNDCYDDLADYAGECKRIDEALAARRERAFDIKIVLRRE